MVPEAFKFAANSKKKLVQIKPKGFTLVEIMIVVSIVVTLAGLAAPGALKTRITANEANAKSTLKVISTACETYALANNGNYPTAMADLTGGTPPYLNQDYTAGPRKGYTFACVILTAESYSCTAIPQTCNSTGVNSFTVISGGIFNSTACN